MSTMPPPPQFPVTQLEIDEPPTWPKTIGIVSIVWASLGLTCTGCGVVGLAAQPFMKQIMQGQKTRDGQPIPDMPQVMLAGPVEWLQMIVGAAVVVLLLVAGIWLIKRKPQARQMHLIYAGISVVTTIVGTVLAVQKQSAIAEWARNNADNFWAQQNGQGGMIGQLSLVIGALLGLAYPAFVLVWFLFIKKNPAEIDAGVEEPL